VETRGPFLVLILDKIENSGILLIRGSNYEKNNTYRDDFFDRIVFPTLAFFLAILCIGTGLGKFSHLQAGESGTPLIFIGIAMGAVGVLPIIAARSKYK
jgi:hypothetical protein